MVRGQEQFGELLQHRSVKQGFVTRTDKAPNTEEQLYAAYALKHLKQQGIRPDKKERRLMCFATKKKGTVYTCSYCIFGSESIRSIVKFRRKNPSEPAKAITDTEE